MIRDIIKIYVIEFENTSQINVIIPAEIIAPITIDRKPYLISKLLSPTIKLPVQTPVNGSGTATKPVSIKYLVKLFLAWVTARLLL